jgi:pimeloyl-ACP methyl ester carboxylesterase
MKIVVDGQLIEYSDKGSGKAVVLLHGWGVDSGNFKSMFENLANKYRVISFDFPGFGKSSIPENAWFVGDYVAITAKLMEKLNLEPYAMVGHSFGGRVIIKGIGNDSFAPEKVILIGSAGVKPPKDIKKQLYKIIAKTGKIIIKLPILNKAETKLRNRLYAHIGNTDYINSGKLKQTFINTINEDLLSLVTKIKQPALLIWGEEDTEAPIKDAEKMMAELDHAELFKISGAGHFVHNEKSELVLSKINEFLK